MAAPPGPCNGKIMPGAGAPAFPGTVLIRAVAKNADASDTQ